MLILFPILALVFLAWAPSPSTAPRLRRVVLPVLAIIVLWQFAIGLIPDRWKYPNNRALEATEFAIDRFRTDREPGKPTILLEGSSLTFFGIDGKRLQKRLESRGLPVRVLQFSSPGANHYERQKMFGEFLVALTKEEREKLRESRVLLLREVHRDYDENPSRYLESDTLGRNVFYTDAAMFPKLWRVGTYRKDANAFHWNLIKCTILHQFGVGMLSTLSTPKPPPAFEPYESIPSLGIPEKFNFDEVWNEFSEGYIHGKKSEKLEDKVPSESWVEATRHLREELDPYVDKVGYFATPVISLAEIRYQRAFMDSLPENHPAFGPAEPELFLKLNKREFWFDPNHATLPTSIIATDWLADEIASRWETLFPSPSNGAVQDSW